MSNRKVIRAWRDEDYRLGLNEAERSMLPEHPAGQIELSDAELGVAVGGGVFKTALLCTLNCVPTAVCTPGPFCIQ